LIPLSQFASNYLFPNRVALRCKMHRLRLRKKNCIFRLCADLINIENLSKVSLRGQWQDLRIVIEKLFILRWII
jgi:hypothetical protein